ncbi:MAG TPA: chorismate-binding protein, partial [Rhodocyclaceae bacterium]|nr:chorismate-binding protein [Rhodocyclaceae bacterium]
MRSLPPALPNPADLFALLENTRSPDSPARLFSAPQARIIAYRPEEVLPALQTLGEKTHAGLYACGYISYEAGYAMQGLPLPDFVDTGAPLLDFQLFADSRQLSPAELDQWLGSLAGNDETAIFDAQLSEDEATYSRKIKRIQDLIKAGDTYQVNYTLPYRFRYNGSPAALYRALRQTQRVEFSAFLNFPEAHVLSLSPELFLSRSGKQILTRPMKGTAGRGSTAAEDAAIAEQLRNDPKSRAENLMIVDLLRNDLGRIALTGSVKVPSLFDIETFETLQQMTSTITGELAAGASVADILPSLFPCGSITGAPKHRTMQIIAELEQAPR